MPSFISQLMANNGDKGGVLNTSGLPTLGSLAAGGGTVVVPAASSANSTPAFGPASASAAPMLPHLSPAMMGRPARGDSLKFGLPLPLNLGASTTGNPMGLSGGGMLKRPPSFRRKSSQSGGDGGGIGAMGASSTSTSTRSGGPPSSAMPSPWNNNQKIQDFFLHITDMEKAAHAEQKIIDIRELIARNAPEQLPPVMLDEPAPEEEPSPTPPSDDKAAFKNALSGMLAARQSGSGRSTPAPDNQGGDQEDKASDAPEESESKSREDKRNALANMLNKRNGGSAPEDGRNALMAMLAKRNGPSDDDDAADESESKAPPSRANMLSEMLARRGKPAEETTSPAESDADAGNPLAQMLAKRMQSAQSAGEASTPKAANPLEAMLRRQQAASSDDAASQDDSAEEKNGVPLKDDPEFQQYFKMLKIGHPREVVKHKMQRDGKDPSILDCDPTKPLPKPSTPASSEGSEDEDIEAEYQAQLKEYNEKHGKYTQMLKVGLPPTVVQHKMRMDGVDPSWLNGPPKRRSHASQTVSAAPTEAEIEAHKQKYDKFFKMLRMGLPRGAVEQKMRMAGVDPKELDGPRRPSSSAGASTAATPQKPVLKRQESIRKKLHWEVKTHDSDAPRDSLWGRNSSDESIYRVRISIESQEELEKLFVKDMTEANKKSDAASENGGKSSPKIKKKPMVALIDMKKSQNIAITLARVKMSHSQLKRELLAMNPTVLSTAQLQSLIDMWPDNKEEIAINRYKGDLSLLGSAEKFLWEVRNIPRLKEKLGCLIFKQEFPSRVQELKENIDLVTRGVHQVCSSEQLRQIFIYILQIGNLLNFGADKHRANAVEGFSLSSLVKFSQTKAFVGGITFLQYVVQSIERDVPHLARFYDEIDLISKVSKVAYHSLASEKNALEAGWKNIMNEAKQIGTSAEAAEELAMSSKILRQFARAVENELKELQILLNEADKSKAHFLKYFEEEGTDEELDVLLSHIANFTAEYHREHLKYLEKMKREMKGLFSKFAPTKKGKLRSQSSDGGDLHLQTQTRMRRRMNSVDETQMLHPQPFRPVFEPKSLSLDDFGGQSDGEPDFDDTLSMDDGSVPLSPGSLASRRQGITVRSA